MIVLFKTYCIIPNESEEVELETVLLELNFSSRTSSLDVQRSLEDNVEKRTNQILGPPPGKRLVVFIDDVNMPKVYCIIMKY